MKIKNGTRPGRYVLGGFSPPIDAQERRGWAPLYRSASLQIAYSWHIQFKFVIERLFRRPNSHNDLGNIFCARVTPALRALEGIPYNGLHPSGCWDFFFSCYLKSMSPETMSSVKENETLVSRPVEATMKPGSHLANPVWSFNGSCDIRAHTDLLLCSTGTPSDGRVCYHVFIPLTGHDELPRRFHTNYVHRWSMLRGRNWSTYLSSMGDGPRQHIFVHGAFCIWWVTSVENQIQG